MTGVQAALALSGAFLAGCGLGVHGHHEDWNTPGIVPVIVAIAVFSISLLSVVSAGWQHV